MRRFTLIEMIVAMALMLMLSSVLFGVFTVSRKNANKIEAVIEVCQHARCAMRYIETDLAGTILAQKTTSEPSGRYFMVRSGNYTDTAGIEHEVDDIQFVTWPEFPDPRKEPRPETAAQVASTYFYPQGIAEVGYYLARFDSSDLRRNRIQRWIDYVGDDLGDVGDDLDLNVGVWEKAKMHLDVAYGVTDLNIRYNLGDGQGFQECPDGPDWTLIAPIPVLVEVTIHVADSKGLLIGAGDQAFCGKGTKFVQIIKLCR